MAGGGGTHVAALMRQFVQFLRENNGSSFHCNVSLGAHQRGGRAAPREEEFSSVINQSNAGFTRGWVASPPGPFFFFFMGARIGCGSIWQQQQRRLKSASHCVQVARHKVGGADNAGALMPPSGYAEKGSSGSFTRCVLSIRFFFPQMHETGRKACGSHISGITGLLSAACCCAENGESLISYSRWESDFFFLR